MTTRILHPFFSSLAASLAFAEATAAQDPVRFATREPIVRISIHDLPALLEALPGTAFGKLFAEPDVVAAFELGQKNYAAKIAKWSGLSKALARLEPMAEAQGDRLERAFWSLDWRDWRSGAVSMIASDIGREEPVATVLLEPRPAAEGRLAQRFESLRTEMLAAIKDRPGVKLADEQKVDGYAATVVVHEGNENHEQGSPTDLWMLHLPGQFACGTGAAAQSGICKPMRAPAPGVSVVVDFLGYLDYIRRLTGAEEFTTILQSLGIDQAGMFEWRLFPAGELLQDDLSLELKGPAGGILGALLEGMAPLVEQPLPDGALLQLRCSFDVALLVRAIDPLLELSQLQTLTELGIVDDLRKAWTGGMSLAVVRPAAGALIPRVYASFGIVDQPALDRLLARLHAMPGLETKPVTYEGQPSTQLRMADMPPALQPSYCVRNGTIHFAESGTSLRALLKSAAAGAPPALDVGKAARPAGAGALLPGFEVRFDGAAIHTAMHEIWMPLATKTAISSTDNEPLVPLAEMPDAETVARHLQKGRGVLRRQPDRILLSMSGTAGGPELHALLAAYGPFLSSQMTSSWKWQSENLEYELGKLQITKVHEAVTAFEKRAGKRPASLGELLAAGDLKDASLMLVEGDELAEPVVHDGKELGKSSFRYYPTGIKVSPQGEEVNAVLIAVRVSYWRRLVIDDQGTVHEGYNDFATTKIDELGKK